MSNYFGLFQHMQSEHNLILLESELEDIVRLATPTLQPEQKVPTYPGKMPEPPMWCSSALAALLEDLRRNQKAFFGSKPGSEEKATALQESKRLEKELDKFLQERKAGKAEPAPDLFSEKL